MKSSLIACVLALGIVASAIPSGHAAASATVQNDSMWIDSAGVLHIFGEVKNTGDIWLQYAKITGTLRDSGGGIVDVVYTFTETMYLPPEDVSPFNMIELDTAKSARVQSYTLIVEQQEAAPIPQKLVIHNVADSKNSLGWMEIVGEVENQADATSIYTKIAGTFYDESGKVIYAGYTFTDPSDVPAGAKYPFKMTILSDERTSKVARYTLIAESMNSGYTSVPETAWPILVMAAALTLGLVALQGRAPLAQLESLDTTASARCAGRQVKTHISDNSGMSCAALGMLNLRWYLVGLRQLLRAVPLAGPERPSVGSAPL